jgi:hypothetical protein
VPHNKGTEKMLYQVSRVSRRFVEVDATDVSEAMANALALPESEWTTHFDGETYMQVCRVESDGKLCSPVLTVDAKEF